MIHQDNNPDCKEAISSLVEDLCSIIEPVHALVEEAVSYVEPVVDMIILRHIVDHNQVEKLYDDLINYIGMSERADKLFKRLCNYYFFIDPVLTSDYITIYREMYSDDAIDPDDEYVSSIDTIKEVKEFMGNTPITIMTADHHGDFRHVESMCVLAETTKDDLLIILGDAGINYYGGKKEKQFKKLLTELPITMFCIHGNHERRPESLGTYTKQEWHGGTVYIEPDFPNLLFAKDGEIYSIGDKNCLVIGGAYSVDKWYRLENKWGWWPDEQPSNDIKRAVESRLAEVNWRVDVVFSHTAPLKYEPREMFLNFIDDSKVDKSTEIWLDAIEDKLDYDKWYCGHYNTDKTIDKLRFLYRDFFEFK